MTTQKTPHVAINEDLGIFWCGLAESVHHAAQLAVEDWVDRAWKEGTISVQCHDETCTEYRADHCTWINQGNYEDGYEDEYEDADAVESLHPGIYVLDKFEVIEEEDAKKLVREGATDVKRLCPYEGRTVYFRGEILWCTRPGGLNDTSSLGGETVDLGPVPAGTLVVSLNND